MFRLVRRNSDPSIRHLSLIQPRLSVFQHFSGAPEIEVALVTKSLGVQHIGALDMVVSGTERGCSLREHTPSKYRKSCKGNISVIGYLSERTISACDAVGSS